MHNFFIWLKLCCISPNVGGSEKNRLRCVANGMSGKQRYSKCSEWPPSAQIHASSLFCHWSTVSSTTLCWNSAMSQQDRRFRNSSISWIDGTWYAWKMKKLKNLCNLQVSAVTFSGVVGEGVTDVVFFCDNVNNLKYVWIILLKNDFFGTQCIRSKQKTHVRSAAKNSNGTIKNNKIAME